MTVDSFSPYMTMVTKSVSSFLEEEEEEEEEILGGVP